MVVAVHGDNSVGFVSVCLEPSADLGWPRCSGVVQLFNAVRQQQGEVQSRLQEAGGSLRRTETALQAVSRHSFLQRLRDGADTESPPPQQVSRRPPATAGYRTGRSKLAAGALQDTGQIGSALTRSRHRTHKCCLGIKIVDTQMIFFFLFAGNNRAKCLKQFVQCELHFSISHSVVTATSRCNTVPS